MSNTLKTSIVCVLLSLGILAAKAQAPDSATQPAGPMQLSLEQAQAYALENSPVLKNSTIDLEIAEKKVWETTAIGLPQASAKFSGTYQLKMSETTEMFDGLTNLGPWMYGVDQTLLGITKNPNFGNIPESTPAEEVSDFDKKWGLTFDLTVSQLLFSGAYFVGLQTTKAFKGLSEIQITKSKNDLAEQVNNAYYLVLVMQENKVIMDSLYEQTNKIVTEMEAMKKGGFVDETTVDQMKLTANNIRVMGLNIANQVEVAKNLLRMQMGLDMKQDIVLTDKLDALTTASTQPALMMSEFNSSANSDLQLIETSIELKKLNHKYTKTSLLPEIAAFYQFEHNFNKNALSFTPPHLVGVGVNIPIFGSGMKMARIKQAKLEVVKAENQKFQATLGMQLAYSDARAAYGNALNKLESNRESMDLARKIYDRTAIKLKNGMASSLELTQAQTQLLQAQATYYATVIELANAKTKLEKLNK